MIPVIHRVNSVNKLKSIDLNYGVEVDIRCFNSELILNHDPFEIGESYQNFLKHFNHKLLILNIKETGIEDFVIELTKETLQNTKFFLLDLEIPYIVNTKGTKKEFLSFRFSEYETFETLLQFNELTDWVWIDTFSKLPIINLEIIQFLESKKTCLVSPSRWGRKNDLTRYLEIFKKFNYEPNYILE